jgi:predicted small integral membrane protein
VHSNPVACRLILYKKPACHRQAKTAFGQRARCRHSLKQAKTQTEPWLLATSPSLAALDAQTVVDIYSGRMQIEQSFRDVKNPRWGLGLSLSQTTRPERLAILLLIGALAMFALWLIGLVAQARLAIVCVSVRLAVRARQCRSFRWRAGGWMSLLIAISNYLKNNSIQP